jgi:hypothetical protein
MWFSLAAAQGNLEAELARDEITAKMTPAQIADAQLMASEWSAKKIPTARRTRR